MLDHCYVDDGYSMHQDSYHAMQDEYLHSPHAGMPMKPPPPPPHQYSKQNMMMYNGSYGSHQDGFPAKNNYPNGFYGQTMHQDGFPAKNNYPNGFYGQTMHQNGYSDYAAAGTNGYYMSHASMGGKPPYHPSLNNASHQYAHGGGYNSMMMSSSDQYEYDNYNKVRPRPMRMQQHQQGAAMEYENGNWGNNYRHNNNQVVNCMPYNEYNHHSDDQWLSKSLDN